MLSKTNQVHFKPHYTQTKIKQNPHFLSATKMIRVRAMLFSRDVNIKCKKMFAGLRKGTKITLRQSNRFPGSENQSYLSHLPLCGRAQTDQRGHSAQKGRRTSGSQVLPK